MAKKHAGGRPTLYQGKRTCKALDAFAKGMTALNFNQRCTKPHIAVFFGVCEDTIFEWAKQYPEFSEALKRWETRRDALAFEVRGWSDARWIFCMKNWTDMKDRQDVSHNGNLTLNGKLSIEEMKKSAKDTSDGRSTGI